ncbi:hypothetical protein GcM3_050029 [Golovinomyces cichoracearum]|uniref:Uncharacterized protein n=1 Tax=Golovinomyces cichoracearum TaxID=62708 RepID=A0A420IZE1_9PEZI|nr:hypothetical protein GcM3_050029 [Golovinomyces cichoracearum]
MWVYHEGSVTSRAGWQGPYSLLSVADTRTILKLPSGPIVFPTTDVKRSYGEHLDREGQLFEEKSTKRSRDDQDSNANKHLRNLSMNNLSLFPP